MQTGMGNRDQFTWFLLFAVVGIKLMGLAILGKVRLASELEKEEFDELLHVSGQPECRKIMVLFGRRQGLRKSSISDRRAAIGGSAALILKSWKRGKHGTLGEAAADSPELLKISQLVHPSKYWG